MGNLSKTIFSHELADYLAIALGLCGYAVGWTVFMLPYGITLGGVTGIAALLDLGTNGAIPMQVSYFVLNSILLIFALKILGWKFCTKTIYAVIMLTLFLQVGKDVMAHFNNPLILGEGEKFMSCVLGACLCGLGVGVCFAHNGSTGGTDIVAAIINKYRDISLGKIVLCSDILIIGCNYLVFHDIQRVLFGYVALILMSVMLDYYTNSTRQSIQLFIFSHKYEEIANYVNQQVHRGVTVFDGMGWYSKNERHVLFVLAKKRDATNLLRTIKDIDPNAFISMGYVKGVYGQGFDKIKK